jgi:hypothetical protein
VEKCLPQQVKLTAGSLNVNVLIEWNAVKWKLRDETLQTLFLMQWKQWSYPQLLKWSPSLLWKDLELLVQLSPGFSESLTQWHGCFVVSNIEEVYCKIKVDGFQQDLCL